MLVVLLVNQIFQSIRDKSKKETDAFEHRSLTIRTGAIFGVFGVNRAVYSAQTQGLQGFSAVYQYMPPMPPPWAAAAMAASA